MHLGNSFEETRTGLQVSDKQGILVEKQDEVVA